MKQFYTLILLLFIGITGRAQEEPYYKDAYLEDLIKNEGRKYAFRNTNSETNHTSNYDLTYHKLEWNVDPDITQAYISGTVTSNFTALEDMTTIAFDLADNMAVSEVKQGENSLTFTHEDDILTITLSETVAEGDASAVEVTYSGNPESNTGFGAFTRATHQGTPIVWTLSEPYGAKQWWPCKQDLIDKVEEIDIYVTTPSDYTVASNGLKLSEDINGDSKITHWKHEYPIPAYLIAIAITNYSIYTETVYEGTENEFPIENYVYPENLTLAQSKTPVTVEIMELFGDLFEIYPFKEEKYGHAQFGWGGGMEHTTMSFMGNFNRGLIAHELAHQWFGDKVTCGSWSDLWVNEGYATYLSGIVIEHLDGEEDFKNWRINKILSITSQPTGSVYIQPNDTLSESRLFSSRLTYNKGSMLLHMLRKHIGDEDFFQASKNILSDEELAYGYAKSDQVIAHYEAASGEDLTEFFADWLYGEGYPTYGYNWSQDGDNLSITLNQAQSDSSVDFFEIRLPVELKGSGGESEFIILDHAQNFQTFTVPVSFQVTEVVLDPAADYIMIENPDLNTDDFIKSRVEVYPNPTTGKVFINQNNQEVISVEVYDYLSKRLKVLNQNNKEIDLSSFEKGVYFIKIATEQGTQIEKIVLEK
ncbi:M1 family aminopeptidase [Aureivirga sp. CE67]|uniref:M1 family aminopeptidase n=1 Tax=Aureivirga sp. CE67 TaxID=1788983 RepID=UPI0018CB585F|nr:M1 family aminopeptidase [Aureivirga sp. CE67]